jgi:hypothetical protein
VSGFITSLELHKDLLTIIVATCGGAFALWRWVVDQKWRRVQYAYALIKDFFEKPRTQQAFDILDTRDEEADFEISSDNTETICVTDDFLIGALSTFDQKGENDEKELIARAILDDFFGELSTFQHHIDAGLIKVTDIQPYLEYWILELLGRGRVHDDPKLGTQVAKYLSFFGYDTVIRLAQTMGHPFPKSEQDS